nr:MAG TPA: hypothetical protein [Crassvirales sp.]
MEHRGVEPLSCQSLIKELHNQNAPKVDSFHVERMS